MLMDNRLVKRGEAAKLLGTLPDTLRKREATGALLPKSMINSFPCVCRRILSYSTVIHTSPIN